MTSTTVIADDHIAALTRSDRADDASLDMLRAGQLAKHKLLLQGVVRVGTDIVPQAAPDLAEHYGLLSAVEATAPEVVAAVLRHPHMGAWAGDCLRRLTREGASARSDLGHLGALAATAAIRAGHTCSVTVPVKDGTLMLPTLGRAEIGGDQATVTVSESGTATITTATSAIVIPADPHEDAPGWLGLRRLSFGERSVLLDDLDPYRDYGTCLLAERLDAPEITWWQDMLTQAWQLLEEAHPGYAAALHDNLNSLVPLKLRDSETNISATSSDAFAAIAISRPSDAVTLALALVHEFQHVKLGALIDLEKLFHPGSLAAFYAPWRPDPRPLSGLLHGIYAHVGVIDFWRIRRRVDTGPAFDLAEVEFARWLAQTIDAARLVRDREELTETGRRFVSHMVDQLTEWLAEPISHKARRMAEMTAADHWSCWRLRNLAPDPAETERLARDWLAGRAAQGVVHSRLPVAGADIVSVRSARPDLLYGQLRDPSRFGDETADSHEDPDVAYVLGDVPAARRGYLAQITSAPDDRAAWAGLGLTCPASSTLRRCPDLVYAVHHRLRRMSVDPPDPLRLAEWLDPVRIG
jgi:HEXXH motif-containing protein